MSRIDDIVAEAYRRIDAPYNKRELRERRAKRRAAKRRAAADAREAKAIRRDITGDDNTPETRGTWGRSSGRAGASVELSKDLGRFDGVMTGTPGGELLQKMKRFDLMA